MNHAGSTLLCSPVNGEGCSWRAGLTDLRQQLPPGLPGGEALPLGAGVPDSMLAALSELCAPPAPHCTAGLVLEL